MILDVGLVETKQRDAHMRRCFPLVINVLQVSVEEQLQFVVGCLLVQVVPFLALV